MLLTLQDISDRARYLNARNTLHALLGFGVVPIVNENDTVAVDEIKVGDNDNLAALVAQLIDADLLVLLTDVDGLYTGDPAAIPRARLDTWRRSPGHPAARIRRGGRGSVGGMSTKLQAAQKAGASGIPMVIASGREPACCGGCWTASLGTLFLPRDDRLAARKRWIAFAVPPQGRLMVDAGAEKALTERGKSLLPSGMIEVAGDFEAGEVVALGGRGRGVRPGAGQLRRGGAAEDPRRQDRGYRAHAGLQGLRRGHPPRQPRGALRAAGAERGGRRTWREVTARANAAKAAAPALALAPTRAKNEALPRWRGRWRRSPPP